MRIEPARIRRRGLILGILGATLVTLGVAASGHAQSRPVAPAPTPRPDAQRPEIRRPAASAPDRRLVEAVRRRDQAEIDRLLNARIGITTADADGSTALHWAAYLEDPAIVDRLIRAGADVNVVNDLGATPLLLACRSADGTIAERLLDAGARPDVAQASGETALMLASRAGSTRAVRALLARGADVNAKERTRGQTALMWAAANGRSEVTRVLLEHGADVHARSQSRRLVFNMGGNRSAGSASADTPLEEVPLGGSTPLLFAARSGDVESARMLLDRGANVEDAQADGNTALIVAIHSGHASVGALLLERGANVHAAPLGYTALHAAVLRGTLRDRGVSNSDPMAGIPMVKALIAKGADVNAVLKKGTPVRRWSQDFAFLERWVGATPFWLASRFLEIDMMRTLGAAGADVKKASRDGSTPLMVAAGQGYSRASGTEAFIKDRRDFSSYNSEPFAVATAVPVDEQRRAREAVLLALELGADVNQSNNAGDTAVHAAAALGMNSVIEVLASRGAHLSAKNRAGRAPADVARRDDGIGSSVVRSDTVALLAELGAK